MTLTVNVKDPEGLMKAVEQLNRRQAEIEAWIAQGDRIFGHKRFGVFNGLREAFAAGDWWADRPWRKRP